MFKKQFKDSSDEDDEDRNVRMWKRIETFNKKALKEQENNNNQDNSCNINEI